MYFWHPTNVYKNRTCSELMIVFPNAKINLGLNILNKRADGYHDLQTIFYPVNVKDVLEVIESDELKFTSSGIKIPGDPEENLCLRVFKLLSQDFDLPNIHIHLHKNIPIGAGLGGGSSDAAFLMKLLNEKFELNISEDRMEEYCRHIGSDCAFFIRNQPVLAYDKGDHFLPLNLDLSNYFMVVVMPPVHASTADAYSGIIPCSFEKPLEESLYMPIKEWKNHIRNDFEKSVKRKFPQIEKIKEYLYEHGALYASMSGSGAALYALFENEVHFPELEQENRVFYGV